MIWKPTEEEQKYLDLVSSMSIDCRLERGTETRATYTSSLRMIADNMDKLPEKE